MCAENGEEVLDRASGMADRPDCHERLLVTGYRLLVIETLGMLVSPEGHPEGPDNQ
jgi:hypothetical protein